MSLGFWRISSVDSGTVAARRQLTIHILTLCWNYVWKITVKQSVYILFLFLVGHGWKNLPSVLYFSTCKKYPVVLQLWKETGFLQILKIKSCWQDFCVCTLYVFNFSSFIAVSAIRFTSEEVNPLRWTRRHSEPAVITPPQETSTVQFCLHIAVVSSLIINRPVS
jgi:hypothetical protein